MVAGAYIARLLAEALQGVGYALLWLADVATTCARLALRGSSACLARAREWDPRLWARGEDPRNDARERRR